MLCQTARNLFYAVVEHRDIYGVVVNTVACDTKIPFPCFWVFLLQHIFLFQSIIIYGKIKYQYPALTGNSGGFLIALNSLY